MSYKFSINIHKTNIGIILAICDAEIEKKIESIFYSGTIVGEEKLEELIKDLMSELVSINALGENSVNLLVKLGLASKEQIGELKGYPHIIVFFV